MACKRATPVVWVAVVAVATIMVVENGRLCMALDMEGAKDSVANSAEAAKKGAESWSTWAYNKVSGKLSLNPKDMKQGAEDMMHKATEKGSDAKEYTSTKLHAISHSSVPGAETAEKLYDEAKNKVGSAYDSVTGKKE